MAAANPLYDHADFFERQRRERELPVGIGVPDFEQALLLMSIHDQPQIRKESLAYSVAGMLARHPNAILRYIDSLESLRFVYKSDGLRYTLTPSGKERLDQLTDRLRVACRMLSFRP